MANNVVRKKCLLFNFNNIYIHIKWLTACFQNLYRYNFNTKDTKVCFIKENYFCCVLLHKLTSKNKNIAKFTVTAYIMQSKQIYSKIFNFYNSMISFIEKTMEISKQTKYGSILVRDEFL